ncbi:MULTISPECIES: hypothetical protein [Streptomyces]|uniref:hypothetical protein n=1 Tax=Streptomyces TaxID=1883 RepID=UPI001F474BA1|nr:MULTISPECIES: hypothetical protein [Streptomyces]
MSTETPPPAEPPAAPEAPPMPAEPPAAAPKKRPSPLLAGILGLAVGAGAVGATWAITANQEPPAPATFTLTGAFALTEGATRDGDGCIGTEGYDDIAEGTSVTVYDGAGKVAATGNLGKSKYAAGACAFEVSVPDVPKGEKFYQVEVSHRGKVQLSGEEAEAGEMSVTLG